MITFVTGNPNKLKEIQAILAEVELVARAVEIEEIQSMNLREIVQAKAGAAFLSVDGPVIVEDVSFELAALGGMPGPFVKWWEKAAGYETALLVCKQTGNFSAIAKCGAAFFDGKRFEYVEGCVNGRLTDKSDGDGFGFDFYFVPDGYDKTFAELGSEIKNQISHRACALKALEEKLPV